MSFEDNPDDESYERDLMLNEIKELQSTLAAATAENERLRGEYKALNRQLAVAKKIFDSCRNNDNHWGDVEVENHRLKADLAAKDAMLAAAEARLNAAEMLFENWRAEYAIGFTSIQVERDWAERLAKHLAAKEPSAGVEEEPKMANGEEVSDKSLLEPNQTTPTFLPVDIADLVVCWVIDFFDVDSLNGFDEDGCVKSMRARFATFPKADASLPLPEEVLGVLREAREAFAFIEDSLGETPVKYRCRAKSAKELIDNIISET